MKKGINSVKKLAFGMWCGVKVVASCCMLHFYVMNSVPNFFDRLSCQYIHMYRKIISLVQTGFQYLELPSAFGVKLCYSKIMCLSGNENVSSYTVEEFIYGGCF
jgi:hypothetical protein